MNYKQRVLDEAFQLFSNIIKLDAFIKTDVFNKMPEDEVKLMHSQIDSIRGYYDCLRARLDKMLND